MPPLPSQAGLRGRRAAAEGRAGDADAKGAGAARSRRLAALGQRRHPGAALREDGGASHGRRSRGDRAPRSASCSSSGARRPTCRARRAKRCGGGSRRRTTRSGHAARRISPRRPGARARTSPKKIALCERAEALADSTNWIQTAEEIKGLQAEWKTDRPGDARTGKGHLGAVPRRVRSLLHPPPGRSGEAQGGLGREPREEGSAVRRRPRRSPSRPTGSAAAAEIKRLQAEWKTIGPVKKSRSEAHLAAVPRRLRSLSSRATRSATTSRAPSGSPRAKRFARSSRRCRRAARDRGAGVERARRDAALAEPEPPSDLRPGARFEPLAAGARRARRRSRTGVGARSALCRRASAASSPAGPRPSPAPISIPTPTASAWNRSSSGWRTWRRRSLGAAPADGDAVADHPARGDAEGSAGGQHDRRESRRREPAGAPRWKTSGRRRRAGRVSDRCRRGAARAGRSLSARDHRRDSRRTARLAAAGERCRAEDDRTSAGPE